MNYYFNSRNLTLTVILKPSARTFTGEGVVKVPGIRAHFVNGVFITDDEDTANRLRAIIAKTHDPEIAEIPGPDSLVFVSKKGSRNLRQPASGDELSKTLNPATVKVAEKEEAADALKCAICDKKFKNQKALNMHLVSHRPGVQVSVTDQPGSSVTLPAAVEEKPEA